MHTAFTWNGHLSLDSLNVQRMEYFVKNLMQKRSLLAESRSHEKRK